MKQTLLNSAPNRKRMVILIGTAIIPAVIILVLAFALHPGLREKPEEPLKSITIAVPTLPHSGLMFIAMSKNFFQDEGLDIKLQPYLYGKPALQALLDGKADLAISADTPIVLAALKGENFLVVAEIFRSEQNTAIIARQDKGISTPRDLKGKKIGVSKGTNGEFFLSAFFSVHQIAGNEADILDLKPDEMVEALTAGKIDAAATWHPMIFQLKQRLGERGVMFSGETFYKESFALSAAAGWVKNHPDSVDKILRALVRAEGFVADSPDESLNILAKALKMDKTVLGEFWTLFDYRVSLTQALLINLENQARWAIQTRLTVTGTIPNFMPYFYTDGLKRVKFDAVTLIN